MCVFNSNKYDRKECLDHRLMIKKEPDRGFFQKNCFEIIFKNKKHDASKVGICRRVAHPLRSVWTNFQYYVYFNYTLRGKTINWTELEQNKLFRCYRLANVYPSVVRFQQNVLFTHISTCSHLTILEHISIQNIT